MLTNTRGDEILVVTILEYHLLYNFVKHSAP